MSQLAYEDLEIVGFDGSAVVECEAVLPVAKVKGEDQFFLLDAEYTDPAGMEVIDTELVNFSSHSEIEALARAGHLTLLPKPFPAFPNAVVAYVNREFLNIADVIPADSEKWQMLSEDLFVILDSAAAVEKLLDSWADRIMDNATLLLERFLAIDDLATEDRQLCAQAERFCELAICAASDGTLRARIHLRAGLAIMFSEIPERLDNFYRASVQPEFGNWSWDGFQERVQRLADILKLRGKYFLRETVTAKNEQIGQNASAIQAASLRPEDELDELMKLRAKTLRIDDRDMRYAECESIANQYRTSTPIPDGLYDDSAFIMSQGQRVRLTNEMIIPLKADPLIYYLADEGLIRSLEGPTMRPLIDTFQFLEAAEDLKGRCKTLGVVARRLLEKYSGKRKMRA